MFNYDCINDTGQLQTTITGPATTFYGGVGYVENEVLVSTAANDSSDEIINGVRVSATGAVRVNNGT